MPVFGVPASSYAAGGVISSAPVPARGGPAPARQRDRERPVETAFVLGGGGNRGAIQIGMLRALTERGIRPDLLVGTSVGAVNAAAYAGSPTLEGVGLAAEVWRRLGVQDIFPRGRFPGNFRMLERREGVFSQDGLRGVVRSLLRFDLLEEAPIPLVVVATRLDNGAEEWLSEGPALEAVLASSALPGLYPVASFEGTQYFDGGVLNNVGLSVALEAGAKRIFILLCGTVEGGAGPFARPYEAMFAAFRVSLHGRLRRDLAAVPAGVDVVVFEQEGARNFHPQDFSRTAELIEQGYESAREVLDEYLAVAEARRRPEARRLRAAFRSARSTGGTGAPEQ